MPERLRPLIEAINRLKAELDALPPMPREAEDKLWKKLRMEWNYNSNHIEGNTLTYSETEALIYFDRTSGDHTLQEYEEMKAHDVAIAMVKEWTAAHDRQLTQADIRNLNKVILVREFWKEALTFDGQATRRLIKVGEYKSQPNSVKTKTGEMFHYASPEETPRLMTELMDWYLNESADLPPVSIAAEMHYRFIRIHPFDDGNGRVARLLVNYILMLHGFPPIVIESATKDKYLAALQKADAGDVLAFHAFLAERQIASLELALKAARGESLDEPGDALKRLELLKRQLKQVNQLNEQNSKFSFEILSSVFANIALPVFKLILNEVRPICELFSSATCALQLGNRYHVHFDIENQGAIPSSLMPENFENITAVDSKIVLSVLFMNFKKGGTKTFDVSNNIRIQFSEYSFVIMLETYSEITFHKVTHRLQEMRFDDLPSKQNANEINRLFVQALVDEIEYKIKLKGILE
jgi:Fic family protein